MSVIDVLREAISNGSLLTGIVLGERRKVQTKKILFIVTLLKKANLMLLHDWLVFKSLT